jgi:hypothetical protein
MRSPACSNAWAPIDPGDDPWIDPPTMIPATEPDARLIAEFGCRARALARLQGIRMTSEALRSTSRIRASWRDLPKARLQRDVSLDRIQRLLGQLSEQLGRQRRAVLDCLRATDPARAEGFVDRETRAALTLAGRFARDACATVRDAAPTGRRR